ncbi:formate/nitrite transporter family protein [Salinisphaera sp. Q1T1-3]|uniref:formate/nitrite transporter family protein n=1 Tax=Salinisphaera sp. Q1T1-3 TaxID=2321229 RepID=UPI000E730D3D|nr:formate/nitrite transporter family protein [Salinisphaera sp. Q1T1-3]RJS91520.1 formate/nitrite transporter family protein [Salinisphaera sp. Q1T1-3]
MSNDRDQVTQAIHGTRLTAHSVYQAISRDGEEELSRAPLSLWWSALAAGFAITLSVVAEGLLHAALPDTPWRPLVANFGYALGFVVVILGRMQLFTENTITVVLPVMRERSSRVFGLTARLWAIVLLGNLVGTFIAAGFVHYGVATPELNHALTEIAAPLFTHSFGNTLLQGVPAGFMVAAIVWMLPNARGFELWMILLMAYLIGIGDFVHIIVGSAEAFGLMFAGHVGIGAVIWHFIIPALIGNVIGGTLLFSLLAYGQVQDEV